MSKNKSGGAVAKAPEVEKPEASAKPSGPVIAEGKCITSKRGMLSAGDQVKPDYLAGGQEAFDALRKAGYITSGK